MPDRCTVRSITHMRELLAELWHILTDRFRSPYDPSNED